MKFTYILYFQNSRPSKTNLLYSLNRELNSFDIKNELNIEKTNCIKVKYQESNYEITFKKYKNFPQSLKIRTDKKYFLYKREGLITLIWRLMNLKYKVNYGQMEILRESSFILINERFEDRFIRQSKLHTLLETNFAPIKTALNKYKTNEFTITTGSINKNEYNDIEEAWLSFGFYLDYDGWDITNSEFVPITFDEYKREVLEFSKFWNIKNRIIEQEDKNEVVSIIRINKTNDFIEYLIKNKNSVEYISIDVWTG